MACQSKISSLSVLIHSLLRSISAQLQPCPTAAALWLALGGSHLNGMKTATGVNQEKGACNAMQLMSFISALMDASLRPRFNLGIAAASRSNGKHNPQHFVMLGPWDRARGDVNQGKRSTNLRD